MSKIEGVGSPSEKRSKFYLANQAYCLSWKKYVQNHDGKIRAKFSAWAITLKAQFGNQLNWEAKVQTSSIFNNNILISSGKSKLTTTELLVRNLKLPCNNFTIATRTWKHSFLKRLFPGKYHIIGHYIINSNNSESMNLVKAIGESLIMSIGLNTNLTTFKYDSAVGFGKLDFNVSLKDFEIIENLDRKLLDLMTDKN